MRQQGPHSEPGRQCPAPGLLLRTRTASPRSACAGFVAGARSRCCPIACTHSAAWLVELSAARLPAVGVHSLLGQLVCG